MMKFSRAALQATVEKLQDLQTTVQSQQRLLSQHRHMSPWTPQHLLFLSICLLIDPTADVISISGINPSGGMVGYGNAVITNGLARNFKVLRVHAAFHDAYGFMNAYSNVGPGYVYLCHGHPNWFFLGHVTGISLWLFVKVLYPDLFAKIDI